ncbi:MAG: ARPP-1 family domain-containing protein [Thermodesulfobacteriota bacterium]
MLELGPCATHQNMAVFPVFAETSASSRYLSLDEALEGRFIEITEVSEAGDVPNLKVKNKAEIAILILAGEELVGAKQNRIVNATFLIGGGRVVNIPVSCVEQGRWRYRGKEFGSSKRMGSPNLRKGVHEDVLHCLGAGMGFRANQGRVWDEVAAKSTRMSVRSETGAMSDIFESYEDKLKAYTEKFSQAENQKGILVTINDEIVGLEIFDSPASLGKYFEKMIHSYALDAIDLAGQKPSGRHERRAPQMWLEELSELPLMTQPSLDLGQDARLENDRVIGSGLLSEGQMLYLSVFAKGDEQGKVNTRMAQASRRGSMAR